MLITLVGTVFGYVGGSDERAGLVIAGGGGAGGFIAETTTDGGEYGSLFGGGIYTFILICLSYLINCIARTLSFDTNR